MIVSLILVAVCAKRRVAFAPFGITCFVRVCDRVRTRRPSAWRFVLMYSFNGLRGWLRFGAVNCEVDASAMIDDISARHSRRGTSVLNFLLFLF